MNRISLTGIIAILAVMFGAAAVMAQGAPAAVLQPQSFRIQQAVPLKLALAVPINGQTINTTLPVTVALTLDVVVSGGGVVSVQAAPAAAAVSAAPLPTPMVQQDSAGRRYIIESTQTLRIDQVQSKSNFSDGFDLVGVATNTGVKALEYAKLVVTMYDAQGRVVDSTTTYTSIATLEPGQSSPFSVVTLTPAASVASYRVQAAK